MLIKCGLNVNPHESRVGCGTFLMEVNSVMKEISNLFKSRTYRKTDQTLGP